MHVAERPPAGEPPSEKALWVSAVKWVLIVLILVTAMVLLFKSCRGPVDMVDAATKGGAEMVNQAGKAGAEVIREAGKQLATVAAAFKQGTITRTFESHRTSVNPQLRLQVAELKETAVFTQRSSASAVFGLIPLPDVFVEARAPVECTYYLDLAGEWRFELVNGLVRVTAPAIRHNTPAVDASRITYEVRKGSVIRDHANAMDELKKSISGLAQERAGENIQLVRETCRRQACEFVETWLAKNFADGAKQHVKVIFADEAGDVVLPGAKF